MEIIFCLFERMPGLTINFHKGHMICIWQTIEILDASGEIIFCLLRLDEMSKSQGYLSWQGLPLTTSPEQDFGAFVERYFGTKFEFF
jgi:hypothetical protein